MNGTYWGIATQIGNYQLEKYGLLPPLMSDSKQTYELSRMRTRLNHFKTEEQEQLINWGYALTGAAIRRHVMGKEVERGHLPYE